jgi:uncharacterized RDD family membrane protein YckC
VPQICGILAKLAYVLAIQRDLQPIEVSILQSGHDSNPVAENIYCSLPRRLLAMLYDSLILLGLLLIASAIALPFGPVQKVAFQDFWFTLWLVVVCFAYLGACWRYAGMTLGMRAWRIRIVSSNERAVSWPRCLLRFLLGSVSLAAFGLGILWALVDDKNRGWHDLAAQTFLIRPSGAKR